MYHARSSKFFLSIPLLSLFFFSPMEGYAQAASPYGNRNSTDVEAALNGSAGVYSPPAVFVTKIDLNTPDASSTLSGTFTILNNADDTVGDLRYRIELLEAPPEAKDNEFVEDTGRIYDSVLSSDIFALIPTEEKVVPFTYTPPKLPAGTYRLRVQLTTSQGKDLGWDNAPVTLSGSTEQFVDLVPGTILLPEFPTELISPQAGPNVSPSTSFTIRATATNPGTTPVTVTPTVTVYDFATSGEIVGTTPNESIQLLPGQATELDIPITASSNAGVYYGVLSLNSGDTRISPLAQYRWVVRGSSGKIISARIKELQTKANEKVSVVVEYAGPADAETAVKGTVLVEVVDTTGVAGTFKVPELLDLTDAIGGGVAGVTLTRDLVGPPGLRVTLSDSSGAVLDVYEVAMPLSDSQLQGLLQGTKDIVSEAGKKMSTPMYVLIGAALLGILALVLHMQKKGTPTATPLGLFFVIATTFAIAHGVLAAGNGAGIEVVTPWNFDDNSQNDWGLGSKPIVEVFINRPLHNAPVGTYNKFAVPFEYRIEYGVCRNAIPTANLRVRYDSAGGKHSTLVGSASSQWVDLINHPFRGGNCSGYYCIFTSSGGATLNLSALSPTTPNTTVQIGGFYIYNEDLGVGEGTFDPNGWHITNRHAHIANMWLNFIGTSFSPSPSLSPSATPTPYSQFSCTPQTQTVGINTDVLVSEDPFEGTFSANWSAPGAQVTTGTGTSFTTRYTTPGEKIITATSTNFPGGTRTSTCRVQVTDSPSANNAPVAIAKMSIDNGNTYSSNITVAQNELVHVRLTAGEQGGSTGSYDPDGWNTAGRGVSQGGKIEWNSDLGTGDPVTYETLVVNPASPNSADMNLGSKQFTLPPGTYTYRLLKITDAAGAVSNTGAVTLTIVPATTSSPTPTASPTSSPTSSPTPTTAPGGFEETR